MTQSFHTLSESDFANLEAKRSWVRDHFETDVEEKYQSLKGKLTLLHTIISNKWIEPHETLKLQCLGITFGDALQQMLDLEWAIVEDESGRDPALLVAGTSIVVYPQTSISKRIEAGEDVDVYELFKSACTTIQGVLAEFPSPPTPTSA